MGCPPPPYIKGERRRGPAKREARPRREKPTPSRFAPSLSYSKKEGEGRSGRGERQGGRRPPLLVLFGLKGRGRASCPGRPLSLSTRAHQGPLLSGGVTVTLRYSGFSPKTPGTLPVSEYSHPIYQCLCLDHFETPRHVRDHIRDSEQPSVHQNL